MIIVIGLVLIIVAIISAYFFFESHSSKRVSGFNAKYVFITGTDSGFGYQLAIHLDKKGLYVYAGCHTNIGAENLTNNASERLKTIILDITNQESVDNARKFIEDDLPNRKNLWAVVNNAGVWGNISFQLSNMEDYHKVMEVNFYGNVRVIEAFTPLIRKSKGRFVNVTDVIGRSALGLPMYPFFCSKNAFRIYNDGLRRSIGRYGVKVADIEPGYFIETDIMGNKAVEDAEERWKKLPDELKEGYGKDFMDNLKKLLELCMNRWPLTKHNKSSSVIEAMVHALEDVNPKIRYYVGIDALLTAYFGTFAPDWLIDPLLYLFH